MRLILEYFLLHIIKGKRFIGEIHLLDYPLFLWVELLPRSFGGLPFLLSMAELKLKTEDPCPEVHAGQAPVVLH